MKFSKRISEAIKQSGKTQKQIATFLNIKEGNITNWKKNENFPSLEIFYKLCIYLDCSADYLLGLEDESGRKTYSNNYGKINNISNNNFNNSGDINF